MAGKAPDHRAAVRHLKRADPVLAGIIRRVGPCTLDPAGRPDVFQALTRAIVFQQLNGTAASTIFGRFRDLYPPGRFPSPDAILATPVPRMRKAGLSPQKAGYIRDLATRVKTGDVDLKAVRKMEDEAVIEELTRVKGVGRWTAEMVLMFTLGRPDVLPVDDYGFRRAVMVNYRMRKLPSPDRLRRLARPWSPHRTVATWYMWQSLDIRV